MPTRFLYHEFGIRGYQHRRMDHADGMTMFHIEQPRDKLRCPNCGTANVTCQGSQGAGVPQSADRSEACDADAVEGGLEREDSDGAKSAPAVYFTSRTSRATSMASAHRQRVLSGWRGGLSLDPAAI